MDVGGPTRTRQQTVHQPHRFTSSSRRAVVLVMRAGSDTVAAAPPSSSPHPVAAAPWRSILGPESRLPNVYWGALSPSSLRRMSSFTALPPPEHLKLQGEASYRYVRQDSALWSALHGGRLTTSRLKDALGLRDRTAARIVGGPHSSEAGVLKAYNHLLQPLHVPPPPMSGLNMGPSDAAANEAARLQYNADLAAGARREDAGWDEGDRRRVSELAALAVGGAGAVRMRLLWGNLQEDAAVATVACLFPGAQLEEVGLLCLSDPRPWGAEPGELPPLGASPDALITHHVAITHAEVEAARSELAAASGAASPEDARVAARALLRSSLERHTQRAAEAWAMRQGSAAAAATITSTGITPPGSSPASTTSASTSSAYNTPSTTSSSPSAAADDVDHFRARSLPLYDSGSGEAEAWLAQQLLLPPQPQAEAASSPPGQPDVAAVVRVREVVEVKNHCPFLYKGQRKARKRGVVINYAASDRGPVSSPLPLWVPQLQAHMAAAGTHSALLLSRSPSRGVRLFRMYRDDSFLVSALELVRELQTAYVAVRQPPGPDPWAGRPGYGALLERTVAIARGAEVVMETRGTPLVEGADPSAFWKMR